MATKFREKRRQHLFDNGFRRISERIDFSLPKTGGKAGKIFSRICRKIRTAFFSLSHPVPRR
jgi:hypothetical protein